MMNVGIGLFASTLILTAVNYWIYSLTRKHEEKLNLLFAEYMLQTVENVRKELMKYARRNKKR